MRLWGCARMSEAAEKKWLVPKLRFPGFHEEWDTLPLGAAVSIISDRVGDLDCIPLSITSGVGLVSQVEKYGRTIAGSQYKNYIRLQTGDFAYNKSATKSDPEGFIARYTGSASAAVPNSIFTCFRVDEKLAEPRLLKYFFEANLHGNFLRQRLSVGARAHGSLNIADADLLETPIPLPQGDFALAEQRNIADCLESLDDLIAAETEKLEALKRHKRGLLQQLFPAEGETTPRLRFPQFRNSGEWQEKELRTIASYQNGKAYEQHIEPSGRYVVVNAGFIASDGRSRKYSDEEFLVAQKQDILMVLSDLPNGNALAKCFSVDEDGRYAVNQRVALIRPRHADAGFLFSVLNRAPKLLAYNDGMNQTHLSKEAVESLTISIPEVDEQLAISLCLSLADMRAKAVTDLLVQLRLHKAALMQQLFPALDESEA